MSASKIGMGQFEILDTNDFSSVSDSILLPLFQYTAIQNYFMWLGGI